MTSVFIFLILVSGIAVVSVIKEILESHKCPSEKNLRDVVLGRTDKNSRLGSRVIKHLGICEICREKVDKIVNG